MMSSDAPHHCRQAESRVTFGVLDAREQGSCLRKVWLIVIVIVQTWQT